MMRLGELDQAREALDEALAGTAAGLTRNPLQHAIATRLSAGLMIRRGEYEAAEAALQRAMSVMTTPEQDNHFEQGELLRSTAELALARGDAPAALAALVRAEACFSGLGNKYMLRVTHARRISAGLETERDASSLANQAGHPRHRQAPPDADTAALGVETWCDEHTTSADVIPEASGLG
jgi:tetratricopeptide (TPR) repeat protein